MSDIDNIIDDDVDVSNTNVGKRAYFSYPFEAADRMFTFSSTIENIGINHDCQMKNHTEVIILSEEARGHHPIVGELKVVKVFAAKAMWVPTHSLIIIKE